MNEKVFQEVEELLNDHGFTLGPLYPEPGDVLTEGVSYTRVVGELVSVTPVRVCLLPMYPHQVDRLSHLGNAVLVEPSTLSLLGQDIYRELGTFSGFRLSTCQQPVLDRLEGSPWVWAAWPAEGYTLIMHPRYQLTDLLQLLATPIIPHSHMQRPIFGQEEFTSTFASLRDLFAKRGLTQSYDIQRVVRHTCGQKVSLRVQGMFRVEHNMLVVDPRSVSSSWYDENLRQIFSCPRCRMTLFPDQIRLSPPEC